MPITKKLGEHDVDYAIMHILLEKGPSLNTTAIIELTKELLEPEGPNKAPLVNRNDCKIDQIIRNIVSHRHNSENNFISRGYIDFDEYNSMWTLTDSGKNYLNLHVRQEYEKKYN